ncbi:D-alanyl-D-alanine carboxypeptidase [Xylophilus sp. Kf1]|nr:D-alanyl-D-alanine carboxypeptidase [Xylophilus sp. Kf1]
MPRFLSALRAFALVALAASFGAFAQTAPVPPEIAARSYLLLDVTANQILAQKDIDMPVEPASLTKLMSAYLVFDALKSRKITLQQTFPVSVKAWKMPGSRMFIDPKMQVPVEDLIKGMIVQSGNDATMALAEGVGGSMERFVQMMNDQAKVLGMNHTGYKNPEGLTEAGHITTARDLSILATRLMHDFPEYISYYAMKQYRYPGTPVANGNNRNLLLFRDPTVDGLKTGHTNAAGYCLVATAHRDMPNVGSRRLLVILLGTASETARANEGQKLLNWGYTAYEAVKLFDAGQAVVSPPVWKGAQNTLPLGQPGAIVVAVPTGTSGKVKTDVSRPDPLVAPFAKGQKVGTLRITAGDQAPFEVPLVALAEVPQAGVLGRAWDSIRLWIK